MSTSIITPTQLESLTNELLLDMMEYLDVYHLIVAFDGLNSRFHSLLRSCRLHLFLDESKQDAKILNQSISFHQRLTSVPTDHLRTMSLQNIKKSSIQLIFEQLPVMNQLKSLYVNNCWYPVTPQDGTIENFIFAKHGHRLTSLVECSLVLMPYSSSFPSLTTIFPHLRRLSLNDSRWTSNTVIFLINNTPNLRSLRLRPYGSFSQVLLTIKVHVRELEILLSNNTTELSALLAFFPDLRRLRVVYYDTESISAFDGRVWENMIEDHMPNLQRMTLDFCDEEDTEVDEQFLRSFHIGEFWLKKQVIIEPTMGGIVRKISFGKPWTFDRNIQLSSILK